MGVTYGKQLHTHTELTFGPVLSDMRFDNETHAVALANSTPFCLFAGAWTHGGA